MGDRIVILAAVLAVATAVGLVWRARNGRVRTTEDHVDVWAQLGIEPGNAAVTLVQFSSAFCAPCRAVRRVSSEVAALVPGVRHVEVDAESHLEADLEAAEEAPSTS